MTAIVLTLNERDNIRPCLASLDWVDEVIIVDSHSTDGTIEEARRVRPDVRVFANAFTDFGQQRNWALDNTAPKHEWVLFFDADERSTPAFAQASRDAIESAGDHVGFFVCYRNMFLGRWIRRCTLFPSWQLRLLRRGRVRYRKEGHGQREVADGVCGYIETPFDHYGFSKGVADWIDRHNHYSSAEIELIERLRNEPLALSDLLKGRVDRRRCLKRLASRVGCRPLLRFLYLYVLRLGVLDGRPGYLFCRLRVAHEIHIIVKLAEAKLLRPVEPRSSTTPSEQAVPAQPEGM